MKKITINLDGATEFYYNKIKLYAVFVFLILLFCLGLYMLWELLFDMFSKDFECDIFEFLMFLCCLFLILISVGAVLIALRMLKFAHDGKPVLVVGEKGIFFYKFMKPISIAWKDVLDIKFVDYGNGNKSFNVYVLNPQDYRANNSLLLKIIDSFNTQFANTTLFISTAFFAASLTDIKYYLADAYNSYCPNKNPQE